MLVILRGSRGQGAGVSCMGRARRTRWTAGVVLGAALVLVGLLPAGAYAANALSVHGSVEQVYVIGAQPGTSLRLIDRKGKRVSKKPVGSLGGVVFRRVPPGKGYRVRAADGSLSTKVTVINDRPAPKDPSIYNQALPAGGYGYMNTRDGT